MLSAAQTQEESAARGIRVFSGSREWALVLLCMSLAFAVRLFFVRYEYVINTDGVYYTALGRRLITGDFNGGFSTYWSPLYPMLVGISSRWFTNLEFAARFVSIAAGSLLVLPVYLLIREFYGRAAAALGIVLVVVHPSLIQASTLVMTESVYTLALTGALLAGWRGLNGGRIWTHVSCGLLMGCCYLLKPEAIAYAGLLVVFFLGRWLVQRDRRVHDIALNVAAFLTAFLVLFLPYFLYVHQRTGEWIISSKVVNNFAQDQTPLRLSADGESTLQDQLYGNSAASPPLSAASSSVPSSSPRRADRLEGLRLRAARTYRNLKTEVKEMLPEILPYSFILLCIVGLFRTAWTAERAFKEMYLAAFVASTLIGYAATVVEVRYLVPLLPVLLCWTSHGMLEFEGWVAATLSQLDVTLRPRMLRVALFTAMTSVLAPSFVAPMVRSKWDGLPFEHKEAGLWMKGRSPDSPLIMAEGPWDAFYAGGRHIYLPDESYSRVLDYARRKRVDYIVVGARCLMNSGCLQNTQLGFLLSEEQAPPDLQLLYIDAQRPQYKILVYRPTGRDKAGITATARAGADEAGRQTSLPGRER
jgi:4-amino-4-deoxy-L-arabinose transferase-like glycosyltransferase